MARPIAPNPTNPTSIANLLKFKATRGARGGSPRPVRLAPSDRADEAQRVVNRSVDIARGDRVADAEQPIEALIVANERLRPRREQSLLIDLAEVDRARLQRKIEIVHGRRAVI